MSWHEFVHLKDAYLVAKHCICQVDTNGYVPHIWMDVLYGLVLLGIVASALYTRAAFKRVLPENVSLPLDRYTLRAYIAVQLLYRELFIHTDRGRITIYTILPKFMFAAICGQFLFSLLRTYSERTFKPLMHHGGAMVPFAFILVLTLVFVSEDPTITTSTSWEVFVFVLIFLMLFIAYIQCGRIIYRAYKDDQRHDNGIFPRGFIKPKILCALYVLVTICLLLRVILEIAVGMERIEVWPRSELISEGIHTGVFLFFTETMPLICLVIFETLQLLPSRGFYWLYLNDQRFADQLDISACISFRDLRNVRSRLSADSRGANKVVFEASYFGSIVAVIRMHSDSRTPTQTGTSAFFNGETSDKPLVRIGSAASTEDKTEQLRAQRLFTLMHEAKQLKSLRHPNIIRFFGVCLNDPESDMPTLIVELAYCNLQTFLQEKNHALTTRLRLVFLSHICSALYYLHSRETPVFHRDIKTSNILVVGPVLKLGDLGSVGTRELTRRYASPRMLEALDRFETSQESNTRRSSSSAYAYAPLPSWWRQRQPVDEYMAADDTYSAGLVMYEILTGITPVYPSEPDPPTARGWLQYKRSCSVDLNPITQNFHPSMRMDELVTDMIGQRLDAEGALHCVQSSLAWWDARPRHEMTTNGAGAAAGAPAEIDSLSSWSEPEDDCAAGPQNNSKHVDADSRRHRSRGDSCLVEMETAKELEAMRPARNELDIPDMMPEILPAGANLPEDMPDIPDLSAKGQFMSPLPSVGRHTPPPPGTAGTNRAEAALNFEEAHAGIILSPPGSPRLWRRELE